MKKFLYFVLSLSLFTINIYSQTFTRIDSITAPAMGGFGNIVSGVDFDKDGKLEIYAVNNNVSDTQAELLPTLFKYEYNVTTQMWDSVWSVVMLDIPQQNTWPGLTTGDLDKDGRPEIIWAPANYLDATTNPNPDRIIVFEYPNDGSDNLGISDGFGGYTPNAKFKLTDTASQDIRPFRLQVVDIDNDNKNELIFVDRQGAPTGWDPRFHFGVVSVSDIPDNGGGAETWTIEASGKGDPLFVGTGPKWDFSVIGDMIFVFGSNGNVYRIKASGGTYNILGMQTGLVLGGSFKGSAVVDLNKDGTNEIVMAQWQYIAGADSGNIWLLRREGDSLVSSILAQVRSNGLPLRMNGADAGDIDGDGNIDLVFGSRYVSETNPNPQGSIWRLAYKGGDMTVPTNYQISMIDSLFFATGSDYDIIDLANLDGDPEFEITYASGYPRGADDSTVSIVVLDWKWTAPTGVEADLNNVPNEYFLTQNYPNPFNPSTSIEFGLSKEAVVDLRVYNVLGQEVAVLVDNYMMKAGTFKYNFDGSKLSSGNYIYKLRVDGQLLSKKMTLMK